MKMTEFISLNNYVLIIWKLSFKGYLTLRAPNKNGSRRYFNFLLYLSKKTRLDFSCESSASQRK